MGLVVAGASRAVFISRVSDKIAAPGAMLETCGSAGKGASAKEVYLPGDRVVEVSSNGRRWNAGPGRYTHAHSSAGRGWRAAG